MEIVSLLRRGLAERLGQDRFELWFGRAVRFEWRQEVLVVLAADQFLLDRLKLRFRPDLSELGHQLLGRSPSIEFLVDTTLKTFEGGHRVLADKPKGADEPNCGVNSVSIKNCLPQIAQPIATPPTNTPRRRFAEFDSYVPGDGNRVALTAAQMVATRMGRVSPLLIYGPNGCGKTHVLEALLMSVRQRRAVKRSVLISAEQFTTHFLEALQGSGLPNFRRKYRDVELLLIDDVQFFAGKKATLVELLHTLDSLSRSGRQVVVTADRAPSGLNALGSELVARMTGGLVCGIEPADYATRLEIAKQSALKRGMQCPDEVLELIARELSGDGRRIIGALNRLEAASHALNQPISLDFAQSQLTDLLQAACRLVRLPDIEQAICDVYGLGANSLQHSAKSKELNEPRMLAMWLARKYTRAAFSEIGAFFGRRSHSTVIAANKRVVSMLENHETTRVAHASVRFEEVLRRVEQRLKSGS